jgi:trimethylamine--corrinoid protein Co-methyltransferase
MQTFIQVLTDDDVQQVHERTLGILAKTGVRVETEQGRHLLNRAGAEVDANTRIVKFPRRLVEESLELAPKIFTLGARRPGWNLPMNSGNCVLCNDAEATWVIDARTGERRPSTFDDWINATRLTDALDEIGVYWTMVEGGQEQRSHPDMIRYWRHMFGNFSKHVQDSLLTAEHAPLLLEILQIIFGDRETIRREHPFSYLLTPQSPLVIEGPYTDAYLELAGWNIPVMIMPMPLLGGTAPGSLVSTLILGNCEILATICLIQAAEPGTPVIYAPALATMDPRSGRYSGGAVEQGVMGIAAIQMARFYGLPANGCGMGTDHQIPGIQAGYERAMNGMLSILAWPDLVVGPGLLGGSMNLSLEQLLIDAETFRMIKQAHQGINTATEKWLDNVIASVGPGGNFLAQKSTRSAFRDGEVYVSQFGLHESYESWSTAGHPRLIDEAHEQVKHILATHQPLALPEDVERELDRLIRKTGE